MKSCVNKLVLGTVQFGLNYGINNQAGQVSEIEVESILKLAHKNGITTLDTSSAYGNSEVVLGKSLKNAGLEFRIVSKYPQSDSDVEATFSGSLSHLHQEKLYGYLIHHFDFYLSYPQIWEEMQHLKDSGKIEKIGFSIYTLAQLQYLLEHKVKFDIIQFPYNLLDRQFEPYLQELKESGVEIHTRSAFLQGLFFKDVNLLNDKLLPLKTYLKSLHEYCEYNNLPIESLALNYVASNPFIDGVLIGVDNHLQLQANIDALQSGIRQQDIEFISSIKVIETELLNPVNWK
ncbi:aldo/keto reductase [Bacteroides thetaiotaomicron]|jgi:putative LPS biosynthesis related aldo/keto reductase|uniref:aldo/keto reductase n=1 Tax=Bacteroides thetaiotaomicron TaxID=818 RepID=UPI0021649471|nr:aldo/keto reductase [Bacteroides thetaiotaomicron]UVR91157.1 aldo/keto reductase [Bacteroides thetaiotaomicron]